MAADKKGFKWDGRSRVPTKEYKENYDRIFKLPTLKQDIVKSVTQNSLNKKYGDIVENIIQRKLKDKKNDE
jgi:methyltransferase-like protein